MSTDDIGEIDIAAYVDGELDPVRTCQVERHLAQRPDEAARVMADLAGRSALRLLAGASETPEAVPPSPEQAIRGGRRSAFALALFAAVAVAAMVIPNVRDSGAAAGPAYLDDALMSHRVALMRARMVSQAESPEVDAADLLRETHIRVPRLPAGWRVTDAQIFPSDEGPALQLSIHTGRATLSIFAVRSASNAPDEPEAMRRDGQSIAFWRDGDLSYAVIGDGTPEEIDRIADDLEDKAA